MPGQVVGVRAVGYTQSKRRFPAFIEGLTSSLQASIGSAANRFYFEDFLSGIANTAGPLTSTVAQGGAYSDSTTGIDTVNRCRGVVQLGTGGTNSDGRSAVRDSAACVLLGLFEETVEIRLFLSALSTVGEEFSVIAGFSDNFNAATLNAVDCAFFRYNRLLNGGNFWACVTSSNSNADPANPTNTSVTVTSVAPTISSELMQTLKIVSSKTTGVCRFYIDDVLVATHTQNIPTGAGRLLGHGVRILKSAGTAGRTVFLDWMRMSAAA